MDPVPQQSDVDDLPATGPSRHHINWGLSLLAERIERQLRAGRARRNIVAKVPEQRDQGLDTKDNINVDWHSESYKEIRNPAE